jgi:hypothetical protein
MSGRGYLGTLRGQGVHFEWCALYLCTLLGAYSLVRLARCPLSPNSDQVLHRSEMSRWAMCGLMHLSKSRRSLASIHSATDISLVPRAAYSLVSSVVPINRAWA